MSCYCHFYGMLAEKKYYFSPPGLVCSSSQNGSVFLKLLRCLCALLHFSLSSACEGRYQGPKGIHLRHLIRANQG